MDDNYSEYTPVLLNGLDNFYAGKGFPTYCIYQVAGMPTLSMSTYSFLYPLTHVSYIISKYLLMDVYHFNDVFALIHLFIGYVLFYGFLKRESIPPAFALIGTLLFTFCGFNLMGLRSQYYIAPTVLFLPLLFWLVSGWNYVLFSTQRIVILMTVFVLYIYSGNIQFFVYTVFFFFLFVVMRKHKKALWKNIAALAIISGVTLVVFSPMAIAVKNETAGFNRLSDLNCGISNGLISLMGIPVDADLPCEWGTAGLARYNAQLYHGAGVLIIFTFLAFIYKLIAVSGRISKLVLRPINCLYIIFLIAFLSSLGRAGIVWVIQSQLPVLSSFSLPFKYLIYVQFFGTVIGIRTAVIVLRKNRWNLPLITFVFILVQILYLAWHVSNTKQAYFVFNYDKPYPKAEWLLKCDTSGLYRIVPVFPWRSEKERFETSLALNFATQYKQMSTYVYEPLLFHDLPDFEKHYREYGVRYFVISKHKSLYEWENEKEYFYNNLFKLYKDWQNLDTVYEDKDVLIFENKDFANMLEVYDKEGNRINANFRMNELSDGVEYILDTPDSMPQPERIMLNFFKRSAHRVWLDEKEIAVGEDRFRRIEVKAKEWPRIIRMKYDPFF